MLPFSMSTHMFATHIRMDSLFFGVLLSYCWHFKGLATHTWLARRSTLLFGIGVSLLLPAFLFQQRTMWIPVAGLTLFFALAIVTKFSALLIGPIVLLLSERALVTTRFPLRSTSTARGGGPCTGCHCMTTM